MIYVKGIQMKKLCKLFYNNGNLGKWILYDSETTKVLELKKFDKNGEDTHPHLLEIEMLEQGILELDHSVKVWEVELMMSEIPEIPSIQEPPLMPNYNELPGTTVYGPIPGNRNTYTVNTSVFGYSTIEGGGGGSSGIEGATAVAGSTGGGGSNGITYYASNLIPKDMVVLLTEPRHTAFLRSMQHIGIDKNYERKDEDFPEIQ